MFRTQTCRDCSSAGEKSLYYYSWK